jgi:hypothetical protein
VADHPDTIGQLNDRRRVPIWALCGFLVDTHRAIDYRLAA